MENHQKPNPVQNAQLSPELPSICRNSKSNWQKRLWRLFDKHSLLQYLHSRLAVGTEGIRSGVVFEIKRLFKRSTV